MLPGHDANELGIDLVAVDVDVVELPVDEPGGLVAVTELAVDELAADEIAVDGLAVDELAVDGLAVDELLLTSIPATSPISPPLNENGKCLK